MNNQLTQLNNKNRNWFKFKKKINKLPKKCNKNNNKIRTMNKIKSNNNNNMRN